MADKDIRALNNGERGDFSVACRADSTFFAKRGWQPTRHLKPYKGPHQLFSILFWHEHVEPRISLFDQDKL